MRQSFMFGLICWLVLIAVSISYAEGTTAETIQIWKDKAKQGDVQAPFQLGISYEKGQGVKKNLVEAAKWYQLGADRGDLQAALTLANMYLKGEGVQRNEGKAIELYTKAGKGIGLNASIARANLLLLAKNYSLGSGGVKPNKTKANSLFKRLFEIEEALMDKGQAEIDKSIQKFNEAVDTIESTPKEVFDELKKTDESPGKRWKYFASNFEGCNFYYDTKSIINLPNTNVKVWQKMVCPKANGADGGEMRTLKEIDCNNRTYRLLQIEGTKKDGSEWHDFKPSSLGEIEPETWMEALYVSVCK